MESLDAEFNSFVPTKEESPEIPTYVYRVFVKPHNNSSAPEREYFVEAENETDAVSKILSHGDAPTGFGNISVHMLRNGVIVS